LNEPKTYQGIMVSSTFTDLMEHRQKVIKAIDALGFRANVMENDGARADFDVIESSLNMVRDSAAYVGVISQKYGQTPLDTDQNPDRLSITELEFNEAMRLNRPIVLFIMGERHPVLKADVEIDPNKIQKLDAFRERAKRMREGSEVNRVYAIFESLEQFSAAAAVAIGRLVKLLESSSCKTAEETSPPGEVSLRALSASKQQAEHVAPTMPVMSIDELRLAYDRTERSRWPCRGASIDDLNDDLIAAFVQKIEPEVQQAGISGERLAVRLGLLSAIKSEGRFFPHHAAVLCFGRNPERYFPQARAAFFVVNQQEGDPILDQITGPLSVQITRLINLTSRELTTRVSFDQNGQRVELDEIPLEVLREAISNAIAHRDYGATGTVQVRVTNDVVEIINPGSFPAGYSWDSFLEAREGSSSPTDAAIAYYLTIQLRFEGVGLGFSTFRKYIEKNGKEAIQSEVGPGPTVKVRIRRPKRSIIQVDATPNFALSNVPISVPRYFLGRDEILADIKTALASEKGRVAITALFGMRGVGKTALAAVYAEEHRADYRATWWIRAETDSTTRADLVGLGVRLDWVAPEEKEEPAIATVMERLRHQGAGILLIFDNAIDADSVEPYLPNGGDAQIIITSNAHAWRDIASPMQIDTWPRDVGADYLVARTGRTEERQAAQDLSQALGGLPLAHEQAAAYCERLGVPLATYQRRYDAAPVDALDDMRDAPRAYHNRLTAAKTFALAIDEVAKLHPAAQSLIVYAALLAPEPIPLFLFSEAREQFDEPLASALQGDGLDEAVAALRAFGLAEREAVSDERNPSIVTDCIRLQRLVRQIAATRLKDEALEDARGRLVKALAAVYPSEVYSDPGTWPRARRLDALALALVGGDFSEFHGRQESYLLNRLALYRQGPLAAYAQARPLFERALAIDEKVLGPDHPGMATSLNNLGYLLGAQGDLSGSRPYLERALAISEKMPNPDHPDRALSLNNLGALLRAQGDLAGARPYYERALAIRETALGPDHPETASSLNNLGSLLQAQGDMAGSRPYFERALAIREKALGPDHPDTATSLNDLGYRLQAQGDLSGARPYYERALAIFDNVLGAAHPMTKTVARNTAAVLQALKCPEEAKALREKFGIEN
jgi:tetratricopeptide (TPR) repeat protein